MSPRADAVDVWRASVAAGEPLTGAALGERFGRSSSWGRGVIADGRRTTSNGDVAAASDNEAAPGGPVAVRRVTAAAVALVALVAAAASYSHMSALALDAGEGVMARALPLSVDGLVVAASMTLLSAKRAGRPAGVLPWAALLLGLGASLAANVAAAEPTVVGRLVAAWPPVALALSFELLLRQARGETS